MTEAAAPYAVDEQMRVEALRAAAAVAVPLGMKAPAHVLRCAELFEAWLLRDGYAAGENAALEGSD